MVASTATVSWGISPCPFFWRRCRASCLLYELHFYLATHGYFGPVSPSQHVSWLETLILQFQIGDLRLQMRPFRWLACRSTCAFFARRSFAVKRSPSASVDCAILVVAELQPAFSLCGDSPLKHGRLTHHPLSCTGLDFMRFCFMRWKNLVSRDTDHAVVFRACL